MKRGSFIEETMIQIQMSWFDCWISLMDRNITLPCILTPMWGHLLFIKVNPEANVCPNFNVTLIVNFTLIPLFNY